MRRFTISICSLMGFALCLGTGCSAEKKADEKAAPGKYIVTVHGEAGQIEKSYDMSKAEDRIALAHDLENGHVHELRKDEPPDLFAPKRWDLGLWSLIIFAILLFVLGKFAWKPMLAGLHEREEKIRSALEQAEKSRQESLGLHAKLDAQMHAAGQEIAARMERAHRDALALKEQMQAEAKAEAQRDRERLHREIDTAKDQALKEIYDQTVMLAAMLSTKAIGRTLTADDHRRLFDETLVELKTAGKRV